MEKQIALKTYVKRSEEVFAAETDGEMVLMSVEDGNYFGLNGIGKTIWSAIEERVLVKDMIDRFVEQFGVARETCENDTFEFLEKLHAHGLIMVEN